MAKKNGLSRRLFLKNAASAALGTIALPTIIPSSVMGKDGAIAPSNRITLGAIGVGSMGTNDLQGFLTKPEVRVLGVCDVDSKHRDNARDIVNQTHGDCASYGDFRELLARKDIDAVMITVPDHWHAIIAVAAAQVGKDIYGQKPLAYTIAEGRAICNAVKQYGVVWQTGSQQRSDKTFRRICELVRNGRVGKVHTIHVGFPPKNTINIDFAMCRQVAGLAENLTLQEMTQPCPVPKELDYEMWLGPAPWAPYSPGRCHFNFRWISDYSSGQITDWAGHHCDIAQWAMGTENTSPVEIEGSGIFPQATDGLYDTVEDYRFACKYAEGFTMIVSGNGEFPNSKDGIEFTKCYLERMGVLFEGTDGWIHVNRGGARSNPPSILESPIGTNEIHLYKSDDHKQNFLDCIKTRRPTIAGVEAAHRSIMLGHLGVIAIKLGRKLHWDPVKERFINDNEANRLLWRPMRGPWSLDEI